jgi:hypothetical protein
MSAHQKPLFHRRLLAEALRPWAGEPSPAQREIAAKWAQAAQRLAAHGIKERPLQGDLLTSLFDQLLGYRQVAAAPEDYHLRPETAASAVKGGKTPDAALGFFGPQGGRTLAVVELKAPGADLDARQSGYGNITPVEQAFNYAARHDGCRWVILCNFVELRLYRTQRGQGYAHRILLAELADEARLRELLFLLGRATLLGDGVAESPVEALSGETHHAEEQITRQFYDHYRRLRAELFQQLVRDNPPPPDIPAADHEVRLLEQAQKILDRTLFVCFCEDQGLLPPNLLRQALNATAGGFVQVSRWQQFRGLCAAIDRGHAAMRINAYNGGLFAADPALDALAVADQGLLALLQLADYDFETDLNVNILGHVFEQSIADLEAIRDDIRGQRGGDGLSRRKRDGVFYTPEFITRFMVARTLGGWLAQRFQTLEQAQRETAAPRGNAARLRLWEAYRQALAGIKVVDPACGSGAFLVAAFDYLQAEYDRVNRAIAELSGQPAQLGLFDLDRQILQQNLYGVDLNPESVEITKLSLWLKTARPDRPLNNLDANIRCGNSLIGPNAAPAIITAGRPHPEGPRPFDWRAAFPRVFEHGGFDCILGNPPYVRQETIAPLKPYLEGHYAAYHGVADLYVYFYELALRLLAPAGKAAYIVTNKWLRAGYGEPLRRLFAEQARFDEIIDFGHAPIFEDADTFPCIVVYGVNSSPDGGGIDHPPRPAGAGEGAGEAAEHQVQVCQLPRDRLFAAPREQLVEELAYPIPWSRFGAAPWSLEPPAVEALMAKVRAQGVPLRQFAGVKPYRGVLTGLNEAFLIDDATRTRLVTEDPGCGEIIKPYLRGQDIGRWSPEWAGLWIILMKSSGDFDWPWKDAGEGAEALFAAAYPALYGHFKPLEERLRKRADKGRYWWELRSCDYYDRFERPKIVYQEIQFHPQYGLSEGPLYGNNKVFLIPSGDPYLLACLNSPLLWWYNWRYLPHMKDDALNPAGYLMETLPIAPPDDALRAEVTAGGGRLLALTAEQRQAGGELLDWLRIEHGILKPGQRLENYPALDPDAFTLEAKARRPKALPRLSPAALRELRETHARYAEPARRRAAAILALEQQLAALIHRAYGLTAAEIALLRQTAPPRMPPG